MDFSIDDINCKECDLWETSATKTVRRSGVYGQGTGKLGLWLYGESLRFEDLIQGIPFIGASGEILNKIFNEIGISRNDLYLTNSIRCRPVNDKSPKVSVIKKCMEVHALKDVPKIPPKLVVCLGNVPLKAVLNKQKIKENRGIIFDCELFNCKAMVTYNPLSILHAKKTNLYQVLKADLIKAKEFVLEHKENTKKTTRFLINSKKNFLSWMEILADPSVSDRVCDIETTGLNYKKDKIVSISFTIELDEEIITLAFLTDPRSGWWYADLQDSEIHTSLQKVLNFPIIFFNGIFDVKFFWENNFTVNQGMDVIDMHSMVEEDAPAHKLSYCVSIYNKDDTGYKQAIASELGEEGLHCELPPARLLDYNCDDTYNTHILKEKFTSMMKKDGVWNFYNSIPKLLQKSLTRMSYRGITMDRQRVIDKSNEYREKIIEGREKIFDLVGERFDYGGSSKQIKHILYTKLDLPILKRTDKGNPSTDKYVMEELAMIHEVPETILKLRSYEYFLRMYLDGNDLSYKLENNEIIYNEVDPRNGMLGRLDEHDRIHGSFLACGTYTGRPSCKKPNLLNIPRNPEIRNLFIAPEGWKLIEADYSQAELVLLAFLSQDEQFMKDVMSEDFHLSTAQTITHTDTVDKDTRDASKAVNFLKSYGGGAVKLGEKLRMLEQKKVFEKSKSIKKYKLKCSNTKGFYHTSNIGLPVQYVSVNKERTVCYTCEAEEWLKGWDKAYPKVPKYKESQKVLWKTQGYIDGLYGRRKRFKEFFTKQQESYQDRVSVNYMCQNGVSETINRCLIDIDFMFDKIFPWSPQNMYSIPGIVLTVYDSILVEAPDEVVPETIEIIKAMMALPIPQLDIALKYDIKVGQRFGEHLSEFDVEGLLDEDQY